MNKFFMGGRLVADPKFNKLKETCVVNFTVALNEPYKRSDGTWGQKTAFANCVAWDKGAESIYDKFGKGDLIYLEASLENDTWEDDTGKKHRRDRFRVNRFDPPIRRPDRDQNENSESDSRTQVEEPVPF